jgi:hypothetical protein
MLTEIPHLSMWTRFDSDFISLAHAHQEPPAFANSGGPWTTWLMGTSKNSRLSQFVRV